MEQTRAPFDRLTLHIVGGNSRSRAQLARLIFQLDHHAEVYSDINELLDCAPTSGIVLVDESSLDRSDELIVPSTWSDLTLAVIVTSAQGSVERAVAAIRKGALDYLVLPLDAQTLAGKIPGLANDAREYTRRRSRQLASLRRIERLSTREREVLYFLSSGLLNKEIGAELGISSRTVEIYRANMMQKLGARHPADAVREWVAAGLDRTHALRNVGEDPGETHRAGAA